MQYISHTPEQVQSMLDTIGISSIRELFKDIPPELLIEKELDLPESCSEIEVSKVLTQLAKKNKTDMLSFAGAGAYKHFIPTVVNHLLLRGEFFTAYTPYQPEISQGTLQAIFEFQTMIANLTGMQVANASMYDNSSALAEAALMAVRITKKEKILISNATHPEHKQVVETYLHANNLQLQEVPLNEGTTQIPDLEGAAAIIIQQPNFLGSIEQLEAIAQKAHEQGALLIVSVNEPTALGMIKSPGTCGADIVVGEGHTFGNPLSFGGPYLGFITTKKEYMRQLPGRIAGMTHDSKDRRGFVLTLQAREQHIRREKATSNICTNQALNALAATIALAYLGKELKTLAMHNVQKSHYAKKQLQHAGISIPYTAPTYNEFVIRLEDKEKVQERLAEHNILPLVELSKYDNALQNEVLVCVTELHTREEIDKLIQAIRD